MSNDGRDAGQASKANALNRRNILLAGTTLAAASALNASTPIKSAQAQAAGGKPNILVIFGDDIGITNLSTYSQGLMGYETPNIDRIANEGLKFLHYYGEQS